jgi:hypothetical protein
MNRAPVASNPTARRRRSGVTTARSSCAVTRCSARLVSMSPTPSRRPNDVDTSPRSGRSPCRARSTRPRSVRRIPHPPA